MLTSPATASSVLRASEMDAVVAQEYPEPVRLVRSAGQVARCSGGDLDSPAQAAELAGQLAAEFCGQPRSQPDSQQVDIRLRVPCPAGGHRSVHVGRGTTACFPDRLDGRAQDRLEKLRHPGAGHPRHDRPVGRDSLPRITHEDGLTQLPETARQQVNSSMPSPGTRLCRQRRKAPGLTDGEQRRVRVAASRHFQAQWSCVRELLR
jgi:hypothetical protein